VNVNRGVIVHQGALGDFLLALPVIEGLWRAAREWRLDFWSRPAHLSLLYGKPYVESTFDAGSAEWAPFFQDDLLHEPPLPRGMADAHRIWVFGQAASARAVERLKARVKAPIHWIQSFPGEGGRRHTTDFLEGQVRACGLPVAMASLRLIPDPLELTAMRKRIGQAGLMGRRPLLVLHPGSGGLRKVWPLSRWKTLVRWLRERRDAGLFLVLGPADEKIRPFVLEWGEPGCVSVLEGVSLPALAALLSEADLYIGNDSGVTHLAASMGVPSVVVFGPTDPAVWGPRGAEILIYEDSWKVEEVLDPNPSDRDRSSAAELAAIIRARLETNPGLA
jgi:hypothetical protein